MNKIVGALAGLLVGTVVGAGGVAVAPDVVAAYEAEAAYAAAKEKAPAVSLWVQEARQSGFALTKAAQARPPVPPRPKPLKPSEYYAGYQAALASAGAYENRGSAVRDFCEVRVNAMYGLGPGFFEPAPPGTNIGAWKRGCTEAMHATLPRIESKRQPGQG